VSHTEEFEISGDKLVAKVKELIAAGNVRRITIKNEEGKSLLEIPLNYGVVAAVIAPVLAALGAVAALLTRCVIAVEREEVQDSEPGGS
jgi:hypothetical protein